MGHFSGHTLWATLASFKLWPCMISQPVWPRPSQSGRQTGDNLSVQIYESLPKITCWSHKSFIQKSYLPEKSLKVRCTAYKNEFLSNHKRGRSSKLGKNNFWTKLKILFYSFENLSRSGEKSFLSPQSPFTLKVGMKQWSKFTEKITTQLLLSCWEVL